MFRSLMSACRSVWSSISVEPAYFLFSMSFGLYAIVSAELYISKVCKVNLALGDEICENIQMHKDHQAEVQKSVSTLKMYQNIFSSIPAVLFALFSGAWSDTHGRKFLILVSIFGYLISNTVFMVNTHFFYELRAEWLLLECLQDFTGGFVVFFMSVNAYMADITEPETRTKRIAFLTGLWPLGFNVGKAFSGIIKTKLGFMYNFSFGALVSLLSFAYVLIFVEDSIAIREKRLRKAEMINPKATEAQLLNPDASRTTKEETRKEETSWQRYLSLFKLTNIKAGFSAILRPRAGHFRLYLLLMIFCFEMEQFINSGDWANTYLFLRRQLEFDMIDFTRYTMIVGLIGICAQYIFIPVLSERLGVNDATIVVMDIAGCLIQTLIMAFATAEWHLYVGASIAFLDATSYSMIRCMISKHVRPDEVGRILAVISAIQAFVPAVAGTMFTNLYKATVSTLPQCYLYVTAALFLIDLIALFVIRRGVVAIKRRKEKEDLSKEKDDLSKEKDKLEQADEDEGN